MIIGLLIIGAVALNKIINSPDTENTPQVNKQNEPSTTTNTSQNYTNTDNYSSHDLDIPSTKVLQE